jgi:DGQHR domain-containing protein
MARAIRAAAFELQNSPRIFVAAIPGNWLVTHSTPVWRIRDPQKGFQRVVREERARQIAINVLNQQRTFPNAIVLATNIRSLSLVDHELELPPKTRFLVVDGQHRLWAQKFSEFEATYACVIHTGLSEVDMARLFLEINDNQKRVPSSLRWDLVRLVRPDDDPHAVEAVELVYELATNEKSPLYQRIDLTGEQAEINLKQGSIAPEIKSLVSSKRGNLKGAGFEVQYETLTRFLSALRSVDPDGWRSAQSPLVKARVLRALLRSIPDIGKTENKDATRVLAREFASYLSLIDRESLSPDNIRALQGAAGIKEIYELAKAQMGLP